MSTDRSQFVIMLWSVVAFLTGAGLVVVGRSQGEASVSIVVGGVGLFASGAVAFAMRRWLAEAIESSKTGTAKNKPLPTLFLASFIALFIEVMLIRYTGSQFRVFSFYKNVPLIGCYLGMGIGCWQRGGSAKDALYFLLWLVPLALVLSLGSIAVSTPLGEIGAIGSSEHILGDFIAHEPTAWEVFMSQGLMGGFAVAIFAAMTLLFIPIGRLLGEAFVDVPRLRGYTVNILGSLAGVAVFTAISYAWMPPWVWLVIGLAPLFWWLDDSRSRGVALVLAVLSIVALVPSFGTTVWSPYQKLVGREIKGETDSYVVDISDVFYQVAVDLRDEKVRARFPHYLGEFESLPKGGSVLIVGAGTGNDVSAALHAGAGHVDAVDIDPAIVEMGRAHHPEHPYDDPRVSVIINDARNAFRTLPKQSYDAVVFGLLDSHTQLGISSVRLDNYVFTAESIGVARSLLKPGGRILLTAATFRPWFRDRLVALVSTACGQPAEVRVHGAWVTYACTPPSTVSDPTAIAAQADTQGLPTDNWPFLYLPKRAVPAAYLMVVGLLMFTAIVILRSKGVRIGTMSASRWHMFFMGAAFLLMEVHAINRLALVFGTTWLVSAITISLVLLFIVFANLIVSWKPVPYVMSYSGLFLSLLASWWLEPDSIRDASFAFSIGYALVHVVPIFFAAMIFARSFASADEAGPALGANMLGAVLGGWVEYASMAIGIRALVVLALAMYALSMLALLRSKKSPQTSAASDAAAPAADPA